MERSRERARSAGASSKGAFRQANTRSQEAEAEFNRQEYTNAARSFLSARDGFDRAAQAARREAAAGASRAQAVQQQRQALDAAKRRFESRRGALAAGVSQQPSYARATESEASAGRLTGSGDLAGAAAAYEQALQHLESASREHDAAERQRTASEEAQRQRNQEEEAARRAAAARPPTTAPPTTSLPTREREEAAILEVLATYERAIESEDLDLFRSVKPNLSAEEETRLKASFEAVSSNDVLIQVQSIQMEGDRAIVRVSRQDVVVIGGRTQRSNGTQTFELSKASGTWVIAQISN